MALPLLPAPDADRHWLAEAIRLSRFCPPSPTAFSVGAVLVAADGSVISHGFSRERDPADHAEEVALARAPGAGALGADLSGATLYSSLEPCAARASRPVPCADLIIQHGIGRVVIAWREPPLFVPGGGAGRLRKAGIAVAVVPELAAAAKAVNAHLLGLPARHQAAVPAQSIVHVRAQGTVRRDHGCSNASPPFTIGLPAARSRGRQDAQKSLSVPSSMPRMAS